MKAFIFSAKFLILVFTVLPLSLCSKDDDTELETPLNIEETAQLVELNTIRSMSPHNSCMGFQWNDEAYPNVNLALGISGDSQLFGELGASDADAEIHILRMEIARKKSIDENLKKYSSINYKKGWQYDVLDAVLVNTDYNITKKGGGTLFISQDEKYKIESYPFGNRYISGFAFSSAGLFRTGDNGLDLNSSLTGNIYYTEDDIFSYDEETNIPMYKFVDYRMLLHLRYLVRNGARNVSLNGIKEDGSKVSFTFDADSDLLALSEEFESNEIETIFFNADTDIRIDYFNGIIYSSEVEDGIHRIKYKFGESIPE
ncbi:hypothetical protein [Aurantibacter sp.]|uniref:hypothetical protein n=1 Tax=Aurantibacter sp. TaxID=2807103 RepID=UPI003264ADBE